MVLVVTGILGFAAYCAVFELVPKYENDEITIVTTAMQAIGYMVYIGLANIFYALGPSRRECVVQETSRGIDGECLLWERSYQGPCLSLFR
jgi:hypothetical protein